MNWADSSRRGFTVVELLVATSIVALLTSLALPALFNARNASLRMDCQNRLKNIATATLAFADAERRFPAAAFFGATGDLQGNWVVQLLPYLDQPTIHKAWDFNRPASDPVNQAAGRMSLTVLTCPSDLSAIPGNGNLSYSANGGIGWTEPVDCPVCLHISSSPAAFQPLDLNGNGVVCAPANASDGAVTDRDIYKKLGVFFVENWPIGTGTVRHHAIDHILDGNSQTLCFAENVRSGFDPATGDTWSSANPRRICFFMSGFVCDNGVCSPDNLDYSRANERIQSPYNLEGINSSIKQAEGEAPWPSSYHPGGVNVAFCDGHVKFLSETVNGRVYASLSSPQGTMIQGALAQQLLSDGDH